MPEVGFGLQRHVAEDERLAAAVHRADHAEAVAWDLQARLNTIESSTVWHLLHPLRAFGHRFPRPAFVMRLGIRLVWWAATLQLRRRYGLWQAHRLSLARRPAPLAAPDIPPESLPAYAMPVLIRSSLAPLVSIIIPAYGQAAATLACLRSLAEHPPCCPFEVIVVDDAYPTPDEVRPLADVVGIRLVRNDVNLGFLLSCNAASVLAKGLFLHFLNSNTEITDGAVDVLAQTLRDRPDVGMAGSKLLNSNGTLQEAGGIIWIDGLGWSYGCGEDPGRPEFNYLREADFCSGASLMIHKSLFMELQGFDPVYAPAYYADVDMAFRVRARGLKVMYEPHSQVMHHKALPHGADSVSVINARQFANQQRLVQRWGKTLSRENYRSGGNDLRPRDRARAKRVILVIDHYVPEPDRDAGSRSILGIMDCLMDCGWVVKFWPHNRAYSLRYTPELERRGIEVLDHRWPGSLEAWMGHYGAELDQVLAVRPNVALDVLPVLLRDTSASLSFYGVDLHHARIRRQAVLAGNADLARDADLMERLERRLWRNFGTVLYPSEKEAAEVRVLSPSTPSRAITPFCMDVAAPHVAPTGDRNVLFVAGFGHPPNVDAAVWLVREVMPLLRAAIGPVRLVLAGSNPTEGVYALAGDDVDVTGWVSEAQLQALYRTHRAAAVPLRFGAGVKGKVVEALSQGLPLVTTPTGAQGIAGLDGVVLVRDGTEAFAEALGLLLTDDAVWLRQSLSQIRFAEKTFSRAAMRRSVLAALGDGARPEPPG